MLIYISSTYRHLLHQHTKDFQVSIYQGHPQEAIILKVIKVINQILPYLEFQAANFQLGLQATVILLLEVVAHLRQEVVVALLVTVVFISFILLLVANIQEELDRALFEV